MKIIINCTCIPMLKEDYDVIELKKNDCLHKRNYSSIIRLCGTRRLRNKKNIVSHSKVCETSVIPQTYTHIYILDAVPPIHVVSNHVDTDKLTTANGGTHLKMTKLCCFNQDHFSAFRALSSPVVCWVAVRISGLLVMK